MPTTKDSRDFPDLLWMIIEKFRAGRKEVRLEMGAGQAVHIRQQFYALRKQLRSTEEGAVQYAFIAGVQGKILREEGAEHAVLVLTKELYAHIEEQLKALEPEPGETPVVSQSGADAAVGRLNQEAQNAPILAWMGKGTLSVAVPGPLEVQGIPIPSEGASAPRNAEDAYPDEGEGK